MRQDTARETERNESDGPKQLSVSVRVTTHQTNLQTCPRVCVVSWVKRGLYVFASEVQTGWYELDLAELLPQVLGDGRDPREDARTSARDTDWKDGRVQQRATAAATTAAAATNPHVKQVVFPSATRRSTCRVLHFTRCSVSPM